MMARSDQVDVPRAVGFAGKGPFPAKSTGRARAITRRRGGRECLRATLVVCEDDTFPGMKLLSEASSGSPDTVA